MGNLVAEQFPGFVNVSHSRLLFSATCVDNCHNLWGNHSLTALSIQVTAQCHILFAPSKCSKTTAISSQMQLTFKSVIGFFSLINPSCISSLDLPSSVQNCYYFFKDILFSIWKEASYSTSETLDASHVFHGIT